MLAHVYRYRLRHKTKITVSSLFIAFLSKLSHKTAAGTCGLMKFCVSSSQAEKEYDSSTSTLHP